MDAPDHAFVKRSSYERALNELRKLTGITAPGGTVISGERGKDVWLQNIERRATPFAAKGNSTFIHLEGGFVSFAGHMYYFPAADYTGLGPGGVFLKVQVEFDFAPEFDAFGAEQPWSCVLVDAEPELVWRALSEPLGDHAQLLNPPDAPPSVPPTDYTLTQTAGTVYLPVALSVGGRVINTVQQNVSLYARGSGALDYAQQWGPF